MKLSKEIDVPTAFERQRHKTNQQSSLPKVPGDLPVSAPPAGAGSLSTRGHCCAVGPICGTHLCKFIHISGGPGE